MRTIVTPLAPQIEDFQRRWKHFVNRSYTLCRSAEGESVVLKIRDDARLRQLTEHSPACIITDGPRAGEVYLSLERVMLGMSPVMVSFILLHEVGHWVHRHHTPLSPVGKSPGAKAYTEVQADDFAFANSNTTPFEELEVEFSRMLRDSQSLLDKASQQGYQSQFETTSMVRSRYKNLQRWRAESLA